MHQGTLPHSLMSLQRGALLGHRRTQRQTPTWRGGSHWLLVVTGGDWHGFAHQPTEEKSIWCNRFLPCKNGYLFKWDHDVLARVLEKFILYVKKVVTTANFHLQLSNDHCIRFLPICLKNPKGAAERWVDFKSMLN